MLKRIKISRFENISKRNELKKLGITSMPISLDPAPLLRFPSATYVHEPFVASEPEIHWKGLIDSSLNLPHRTGCSKILCYTITSNGLEELPPPLPEKRSTNFPKLLYKTDKNFVFTYFQFFILILVFLNLYIFTVKMSLFNKDIAGFSNYGDPFSFFFFDKGHVFFPKLATSSHSNQREGYFLHPYQRPL